MIKHNKWVGLASIGAILILILLQWGSRWLERESIISISTINDAGWVIIVFSTVTISAILFYELARGKYYGKPLAPDSLENGAYWIRRISGELYFYQIWKDGKPDLERIVYDAGEQKFFPIATPAHVNIQVSIYARITKTTKSNGTIKTQISRVIDAWVNGNVIQQIVVLN